MKSFGVLLLLCALISGMTAPGRADETAVGFLRCTVKFADRTPAANVPVVVTADGNTLATMKTDAQGNCDGMVACGVVTVAALGASTTAQVQADDTATVTLTLQTDHGVQLTVTDTENAPMVGDILCAYQAPGGDQQDIPGLAIKPGVYWFPTVPADATAFAVILSTKQEENVTPRYQRQWTFAQAAPQQLLTWKITKRFPAKITIVDAAGKPVANAPVIWSIAHWEYKYQYWDAGTHTSGGTGNGLHLKVMQTDANGVFDLGMLRPGHITLALQAGDLGGDNWKFDLNDDGTQTGTTYTVSHGTRRVTQTVFGADGQPASNAEVYASYCWKSVWHCEHATSDAAGQVVWPQLPPREVVVWGPKVTAGLMPATGEAFPKQLPAPTSYWGGLQQYIVDNPPDEECTLTWKVRSNCTNTTPDRNDVFHLQPVGKDRTPWSTQYMTNFGATTHMSLLVVADTTPPRMAYLKDIYVPIQGQYGEFATVHLTLHEATSVKAKFVLPNGTPVPGFSRMKIIPVGAVETPTDMAGVGDTNTALYVPVEQPDGSVAFTLPGPGTYRLLLDLFDEHTPPPPATLLTIKPGVNTITVTLPEPLLTVPAGTELTWLRRAAPFAPQRLVVSARQRRMPVFGPRDGTLAIWGKIAPDTLLIWNGNAPDAPQQLVLRSVIPTALGNDGTPLHNVGGCLMPLLPLERHAYLSLLDWSHPTPVTMTPSYYDRAHSERESVALPRGAAEHLELWSGKYLAVSDQRTYIDGVLDVPQEGDETVPFKRIAGMQRLDMDFRNLRVSLPPRDYTRMGQDGTGQCIAVSSDLPGQTQVVQGLNMQNPQTFVSPLAKQVSLEWLGVGVARNLWITGDKLQVERWEPGSTITGTVLNADGTPVPQTELTIAIMPRFGWTDALTVQTDAQGRFRISGVLPGRHSITLNTAQWVITVPEDGLANLTLRTADSPVHLNILDNAGKPVQYCTNGWWLPDGGAPVPFELGTTGVACYDFPTGPGWLWVAQNVGGRAYAVHCTLTKGANTIKMPEENLPTLGLAMPFTGKIFPLSCTLTGEGDRAGVSASWYELAWQHNPQLGVSLAQLDAVPPGKYRLSVYTPQGTREFPVTITEYGGWLSLPDLSK